MSRHSEKSIAERLDDAETAVRDAIQWLKDGGQSDEEVEKSASDSIQAIVMLRQACD